MRRPGETLGPRARDNHSSGDAFVAKRAPTDGVGAPGLTSNMGGCFGGDRHGPTRLSVGWASLSMPARRL